MTTDPKIVKISNNIIDFCKKVGFTTDAGDPMELTDYQAEFARKVILRKTAKNKDKFMFVATTRGGKTESTSVIAILLALLYDGDKIVIVAPTFKQANKLFSRIRAHIMGSRNFLYPLIDKNKPFTKEELHFITGSSIVCLSAHNPESLLGHGCSTLIIDESGSIEDETYKTRIARMLSGKLKHPPLVIMLGTPHTINFFYEAYQSGDFDLTRVHWKDAVKAGRLNEAEVMYQKKIMSPDEFAVWYEAEFRPLDENLLFDLEKVKQAMVLEKKYQPHPEYEYYAGLDVARQGADKTALVMVGVHKEKGLRVPIEMHFMTIRSGYAITETAGFVLQHLKVWRPKLLYVDMNGLGVGAMDILKEKVGGANIRGFQFQGRERLEAYKFVRQLLSDDIVAGADKRNRLLLIRDDYLYDQFKSYILKFSSEGKERIEKKENSRDDIVDALTMACYPIMNRTRGEVSWGGDIFGEFFGNGGSGGFIPSF